MRNLLYHRLGKGRYGISEELFSEHCEAIATNYLETKISFDDGDETTLRAAEILERNGLRACFFILTSEIGNQNFLKKQEIKTLFNRGHFIGSHGHRHQFMTQMNQKNLYDELVESKKILEDIVEDEVVDLSFPGGRFNKKVLSVVEEAGFSRLWSSEPGHLKFDSPMPRYGRDCILDKTTTSSLEGLLMGHHDKYRILRYKFLFAIKNFIGDHFYHKITTHE